MYSPQFPTNKFHNGSYWFIFAFLNNANIPNKYAIIMNLCENSDRVQLPPPPPFFASRKMVPSIAPFRSEGGLLPSQLFRATEGRSSVSERKVPSNEQHPILINPMFYAYILESMPVPGEFYRGHTENLKRRLQEHNAGKCSHTSKSKPWKVKFYAAFETMELAREFETYLKNGSGHVFAKRHFGL